MEHRLNSLDKDGEGLGMISIKFDYWLTKLVVIRLHQPGFQGVQVELRPVPTCREDAASRALRLRMSDYDSRKPNRFPLHNTDGARRTGW
jgi:hypothetical protein